MNDLIIQRFQSNDGFKVLIGADLHKRATDISTIKGYVNCNQAVQRDLMRIIIEKSYTHFISAGDWYDRGYIADVSASLADYDLDREMNALLKGNFYGVIGNHIRLSLDSNPELHLIQPHHKYKSRRVTTRTEQIMKTPDIIMLNGVQISLMHYKQDEETALDYKPTRLPEAKYHIAIFHTELIVPASKLIQTNYGHLSSPANVIAKTLEGVDLAVCGHIHNVLGKFIVETNSGPTTMVVPGSLSNVDSSEVNRHGSVALPSITINGDGTCKIEYVPFDLKLNMVTFKNKCTEVKKDKLKTLRGKALDEIHDGNECNVALANEDSQDILLSLNRFMQLKGYTNKDKKLVRSVINEPNQLDKLLNMYLDKDIES